MPHILDPLFRPASLAVIGASSDPNRIGGRPVAFSKRAFKGRIIPINPQRSEIQGLTAYPSIKDVPGAVDQAIIAVPAKAAMQAAEECIAKGVKGGTGPVNVDQPYFEFQVEKPVVAAPNSASPRYPEMLKSASVEGEVQAQFVVDTSGRVEPGSFKVLKSSHELFTAAVREALPRMRFLPAEVGGRKVKQLVQQPFQFALSK